MTYTGIGHDGKKHTSQRITEWLVDAKRNSFTEIVDIIRARGSQWLFRVAPGAKHTFVIATFQGNLPVVAVVSNFQRWHGRDDHRVSAELYVTFMRPNIHTAVVVTGIRQAVPRVQRHALQRLARTYPHDPLHIRMAIAEANRVASANFPELISEDCIVYSLDKAGRGHQQVRGDTKAQAQFVMGNIDFDAVARQVLDSHFGAGQWTMKSATFARSGNQQEPPAPCEFQLSTSPVRGDYHIVELAAPPGRHATPRSMNSLGIIVGDGAPRWRSPIYPCVWRTPSDVFFLEDLGGLGGAAFDVNGSGVVVGASEAPDRTSRACIWSPEGKPRDIGLQVGRHSGARAINQDGTIAGWASIHPSEGGQAHFRPVCWVAGAAPRMFRNFNGRWGEGIDVNCRGHMVMFVHDGRDATAWLWNGDEPFEVGRPEPPCRSFRPIALTSNGYIIGTTRDIHNRHGAACWQPSKLWQHIELPATARLTATNGDGYAGNEEVEGYTVPWLWLKAESAPTYLPHVRHHNHHVTVVTGNGEVLGTAGADNCCHAILWRPRQPMERCGA